MFWGGKSKKAAKKSGTRSRRPGSAKKRRSGKKLNEYFTKMLDAKKNNLPEFGYKGKTYKQVKTKTGLTTYKAK